MLLNVLLVASTLLAFTLAGLALYRFNNRPDKYSRDYLDSWKAEQAAYKELRQK